MTGKIRLEEDLIHQRLSMFLIALSQPMEMGGFGSERGIARGTGLSNKTISTWRACMASPTLAALAELEPKGWTLREILALLASDEDPVVAVQRKKKAVSSQKTKILSLAAESKCS